MADNTSVDNLVDQERIDLISHIKGEYSERRCTDVQQLLSTLSNPIRFRILCALRVGAFSVTELVEITDSHLSNISQHLKMMWMAGYISKDRQGKQVYYALANSRVREAIEFFEEMYPADAYGPNANREGCPE